MTIVLSVFFRFTASDYPFDVSKLFFFPSNILGFLIFTIFAEHSTHFQVGGDNPKTKPYFTFTLAFSFLKTK